MKSQPSPHPTLPPQPTLADFQAYVANTLVYRRLNSSTQYCMLMLCEEVGELAKAVRKNVGGKMDIAKPDAHADEEAADVLWMLLTVCNGLGIDLEAAFRAKDEHNKTRTWK